MNKKEKEIFNQILFNQIRLMEYHDREKFNINKYFEDRVKQSRKIIGELN